MNIYARVLVEMGIPVAMDGEGFLLELPEVIDFFRLFKACIQPDDSVAVVSALRSIYVGITDEELYDHKVKSGAFNYFSIDQDRGNENVNKALSKLRDRHSALRRASPIVAFKTLIKEERIRY